MDETSKKFEITVRNIFLIFLKMGTLAFGGVYSMIAFFERELVFKRKWLSHSDFAESIAVGQLTPGPPIINSGIFIGYLLKGVKGGLATVMGQVLPSFLIIMALGYVYVNYSDIPAIRAMLKGVGAAVVGLVISVIYRMGKASLKDFSSIGFALIMFVGLAVFKLNPILLIIISAIGGLALYGRGAQKWR
ncbi:MAG: chromate transporter [Desulfomonilaceae bacterium]